MIVVDFVGKAELGADDRLSDRRDEFFAGIVLVAEAFAELAVEAMLGPCGVDRLVGAGRDDQVGRFEKLTFG